jgi:hypothetical protein
MDEGLELFRLPLLLAWDLELEVLTNARFLRQLHYALFLRRISSRKMHLRCLLILLPQPITETGKPVGQKALSWR